MKEVPLPEGYTELSEDDKFAFEQIYRIDSEIEQLKSQRKGWEEKLIKAQEV